MTMHGLANFKRNTAVCKRATLHTTYSLLKDLTPFLILLFTHNVFMYSAVHLTFISNFLTLLHRYCYWKLCKPAGDIQTDD